MMLPNEPVERPRATPRLAMRCGSLRASVAEGGVLVLAMPSARKACYLVRAAVTNMVTPTRCAATVGYSRRWIAHFRVRVWRSPRSSSNKSRELWVGCAGGALRRDGLLEDGSSTTSRATALSSTKPGRSGMSLRPHGRATRSRSSRSFERRPSGTSYGRGQRENGPVMDRCRAVASCENWSRRSIGILTAAFSDDRDGVVDVRSADRQ
jgi:hypothetical protein